MVISRAVLADIRERVATAHRYCELAGDRRLSVAQQDRADLLREVDRLRRELAAARSESAALAHGLTVVTKAVTE